MVSVGSSLMRFALPAPVRTGLPAGPGGARETGPMPLLAPAESASDRARARMEEIRQRLKAMEQMGFPAEVVARLAATLGAETSRLGSQIGPDAPGASQAPGGAAPMKAVFPVPTGMGEGDDMGGTDAEPEPGATTLPAAYRDVLASRDSAPPSDDAAIRQEFEALAARIRALQKRAQQEAERLGR